MLHLSCMRGIMCICRGRVSCGGVLMCHFRVRGALVLLCYVLHVYVCVYCCVFMCMRVVCDVRICMFDL